MKTSIHKKYIIANIKIPIEILENNEIIYMNEYAQINFEECDKLPDKQNLKIDIQSILDINDKKIIPNLSVLKNEIQKNQKRSLNNSFKNKKLYASRFSRKNIIFE